MAKNYASIYASGNVSSSLEQRFYIKEESVRGTFVAPVNADFFFNLQGGGINHSQAIESSEHRSGRANVSFIKKKKVADWSFSTYFNIDTGVAAGTTEIDPAMRVLYKSLMGTETVSSGLIYSRSTPALTFTIMEVGDQWAKQMVGCFVESAEISLPGDGEARVTWSGSGKEAIQVGIGKSITNNTANTVTLANATEAYRFPVGSKVMIIEADGVTLSADTATGTFRTVTVSNTTTGVVTLDGAVLADADGSTTPIYLVYYEPLAPTAINNPQTGLVGSASVGGLTTDCVRNITLSLENQHEKIDYCYGKDALASPFYVPGGRFMANVSIEFNFDLEGLEFYNRMRLFESSAITVILGDSATRHFKIEMPKVQFSIPEISVPESGSIPVTFEGLAYSQSLTADDELTLKFL